MKNIAYIFIALFAFTATGQQIDYNLKKGFGAEGYDVVAYFNNEALEGDKTYQTKYDTVKYKFASQENLNAFLKTPEKYIPQYGGYCAYAIADKGEKISVNPETFEVRDGKLYLLYNSWGVNTLEKWNEEGAETLKKQADAAWKNIKNKN